MRWASIVVDDEDLHLLDSSFSKLALSDLETDEERRAVTMEFIGEVGVSRQEMDVFLAQDDARHSIQNSFLSLGFLLLLIKHISINIPGLFGNQVP